MTKKMGMRLARRAAAVVAALLGSLAALPASAEITFYEHHDFEGRAFTTGRAVGDFRHFGYNDSASSVVVTHEAWEVCENAGFGGQCMVLVPGHYRALRDMGMNNRISSARPAQRDMRYGAERYAPRPLSGEITFFEHEGFHGVAVRSTNDIPSLGALGFNDRASSVMVLGERWEVCEHSGFGGRCVVLRPGMYPSLGAMGLNDRLSSARMVPPAVRYEESRYAPPPKPVFDWRRRPQERLFEAQVLEAHAVYANQQQRCWVERDRVAEPDVGGAIIGGVIGGIIGHEIGSGPNRDLATAGGAVAGAVIGANAGAAAGPVQRCATVPPRGQPDYWDVTYHFRGVEHHVQTTFRPGPTVSVNDEGEPRL